MIPGGFVILPVVGPDGSDADVYVRGDHVSSIHQNVHVTYVSVGRATFATRLSAEAVIELLGSWQVVPS